MASLNNIKNRLIELQSFDDIDTFSNLQQEIRDFIGQPGIIIGITPFYKVNNRLIFSSTHNVNSVFLKELDTEEEKNDVCQGLEKHFQDNDTPLVLDKFDGEALASYPFIKHLQRQGWKALIIFPLKNYSNLIGILEIVSAKENVEDEEIISKIEPALPLFEMALNRSCATLDARIDKIIKENFTAIQPSVEWKFTEAALSYLINSEKEEDVRIENILFENVHPLYAEIDIKNSSEERSRSIELDEAEGSSPGRHFKQYEESLMQLNKMLSKFIEIEQRTVQAIYPHYFERSVTDGVSFNIYIGRSITPNRPFADFYLRNIKIWQLSTLAKAAQLSAKLLPNLPLQLETTQLILVHNEPINISFRMAEKKFDVDGAYNTIYEILKKRIDKVHIRNTEERLTQPGKIAIVYSLDEEAAEYKEYIRKLAVEKLLTGEVEEFELEELQGVHELKALRVTVRTESQNLPAVKRLLSNA